MISDDRYFSVSDSGEEIPVWCQAQTLIPGIVCRRKMCFNIILVAKLQTHQAQECLFRRFRSASGEVIKVDSKQNRLPARETICKLVRENLAYSPGTINAGGARNNIGWRALKHRDMRCLLSHCWD